jgi:CheY-like chemotaxis protein
MSKQPIHILIADDDEDDRMLTADAFEECQLGGSLAMVADGEELLNYLKARGAYAQRTDPLPGLILLDLNMPRKDGREALADIKADPELRRIPVVVLTTSKAQEDVYRSYDLGVSSFIVKPHDFDRLVEVLRTLITYWFDIVEPAPIAEGRFS